MLRVEGAGDCNNAALEIPAEDDLCRGHAMRLGNRTDCLIPKQIGSIAPAAQRIPALDDDALALDERHHILLLIVRMDLVLHQYM